mgnify:FL=1
MNRKKLAYKAASLAMAACMTVGMTSALTGCDSKKNETITLEVYSQLANYSGLQTGWIADILKDKFNVKLKITPDGDGVYETRMESGDLGDIVIFGNDGDDYTGAVKAGVLYDWNEDDLLKKEGKYIYKNMPDAIKKNENLTAKITDGKKKACYGIGNDVALSNEDHQMFFYNWDVRWDLYKQLGYPKVKDLNDFEDLMVKMQKLCPKDDSGNKTYAVSLWPDWDEDMVMYVKATATAYYGYDELGLGLYDCKTGNYHGALEKNGPYLEMLKFFNDLYQKGLVDPDSMTQTYDKMAEKVQNGGVLFSIFNYSGSLAYNKDEHTKAGKMMYCLKPEDASPIVYGMNTQGGNRITSIGANTEYPELCMEILNYFATPEGRMTYAYGPKGETWNYDKQGNTYFTELGKKCKENEKTKMGSKHKGSFHDGMLQASFSTWSVDAENPDSNGETYNSDNWKSNVAAAKSDIEQDWRDKTGAKSITEYFENGSYTVAPGTSFTLESKDDELKTTWSQVTDEIKNGSWKAMYAKTDAQYDKIVKEMINNADKYGYAKCLKWAEEQAAIRHKLEQQATGAKSAK